MENLKTVYKLSGLIIIALVAISAVAFNGYFSLKSTNQDLTVMYSDRLIPVGVLHESRSFVRAMNGAVLELMLTTDAKRKQELKSFIDQRTKQVGDNIAELEKAHLDSTAKGMLEKIKIARAKYREARGSIIELAMQNKNAEAYALYVSQLEPLASQFVEVLRELAQYYAKLSEQANRESGIHFQQVTLISIGLFLGALLILVGSGWYITQSITMPLGLMVRVCEEFADGDFRDKQRSIFRRDEIGKLADALGKMQNNVRTLMKKINESTEQVAASSEELTASAAQSSQAASQVAGSITNVANGANSQLTAANEASAVVEQMSAGIQQIAANANTVADHSAQAADKAKDGGKAVKEAVNQMGHIETTVNTSAGVVAKLGERSKEIGQIVDTISGIAGPTCWR